MSVLYALPNSEILEICSKRFLHPSLWSTYRMSVLTKPRAYSWLQTELTSSSAVYAYS